MEHPIHTDTQRQILAAKEARSNSVKQLCDLHKIVISIAVGLAFHNMVDPLGKLCTTDAEAVIDRCN